MDVRVVGHCRAPAVEHGGGADASAEVPGVGGDREQRFGSRAEQQASGRGRSSINDASRSRGLVTARIVALATRV